jgi:hypothetical protein
VFQQAPAAEVIPAQAQGPAQDPTQYLAQDLVPDPFQRHESAVVRVVCKIKAAAHLVTAPANLEKSADESQQSNQSKILLNPNLNRPDAIQFKRKKP